MIESPFHIMTVINSLEPATTRFNPPGLSSLTYRAGKYSDFVARMLSALRTEPIRQIDNTVTQPLNSFNILAQDDWTMALLRAWALVTDVLAFYQERIINEAYLRTATERRSVLELIRMVDYELAPPLAAQTMLAFTVHQDTNRPGTVRIPNGTAVQSVPSLFSANDAIHSLVQGMPNPKDELPVTFETIEDLAADARWNHLHPSLFVGAPWPAQPNEQRRTLRLLGLQSNLNPGDALLIRGAVEGDDHLSEESGLPGWEMLLLDEVTPDPVSGYTTVTWKEPTFGHVPPGGLTSPQAYALRRQSDLYAYSVGAVFRDTDRGWAPANIGLPAKPVRAAAANKRGRLYVAIEKAVYHSRDLGNTWAPLSNNQPLKDIYAIATSPTGAVAIGTDEGGVVLSQDGGDAWTPLSGPGEMEVPTGWRRFVSFVRHKLPKTTVRALLHSTEESHSVLAGTDDGVFGYDAKIDSWQPMNGRFPNIDRKKGTATVTVHALAAVNHGKRILAGTSSGVFPVEPLFRPPSNKLLLAFLSILLLLPSTVASLLKGPDDSQVARLPGDLVSMEAVITKILIFFVFLLLLYQLKPRQLKWIAAAAGGMLYATQGVWEISPQLIIVIENLLAKLGAEADVQAAGPLVINPLFMLIMMLLVANAGFAALVQVPGLVRRTFPGTKPHAAPPPVFSLLEDGDSVYAGTTRGVFRLEAAPDRKTRLWRWFRRLLLGQEPEPWTAVPRWFDLSAVEDEATRTAYALALDQSGRLVVGTAAGEIHVQNDEQWLIDSTISLGAIRNFTDANGTLFATGTPSDAKAESRWATDQLEAGEIDLPGQQATVQPGSMAVATTRARTGDSESAFLFTLEGMEELPSRDVNQGGQLTRLKVTEPANLFNLNRTQTTLYYQSKPIPLFDDLFVPQPVAGDKIILSGDGLDLPVGKKLALAGTLTETPEQTAGEVVTIKSIEEKDGCIVIYLEKPLQEKYRRDSVTIFGNLVAAQHGETVQQEMLGESEGTIPNQRLSLRRPLAYFPSETGDYHIALKVSVSGIPWKKVPTLLDQPPDARVYMVRRNESGETTITFGDGDQGARLPASRERLTSSYRTGGGAAGNVPAGSLTVLQSNVPLSKEVTNPLPAKGGEPAEPLHHGRERAPQRLQALRRIVTQNDFIHFAINFPGVGKANMHVAYKQSASSFATPSRITLAIAPRQGRMLLRDDVLISNLRQAIDNVRSSPQPRVNVIPYTRVLFVLELTCHLKPDARGVSTAEMEEIERQLRQHLLDAFCFDSRQLGQPVMQSDIYKWLQKLKPVAAVTLHVLSRAHGQGISDLVANWNELLLLDEDKLNIRFDFR